VDRLAVQDAVNELFLATDSKAWDRVKAVFTEEVSFDMTSLAGGQPAVMTADAIADAWAQGLGPVQAVHHQVGNYVIDVRSNGADVYCYAMATHYNPGSEKTITWFVGSYDIHLIRTEGRWRIDAFKFNKKYVE
jgi:hypothetical protein